MTTITKTKVADHLYIYSRTEGNEYYVFRGTVAGKRIERSLGPVTAIGLKEAKRAAARYLIQTEDTPKTTAAPTFAEILPQALEDINAIRQLRHDRQRLDWQRSLNKYAVPVIGAMAIDAIGRDDVLAVLKPIWTQTPSIASVVRMRLEAVFSWAATHNLRDGFNPALWRGNLELLLPRIEKVHRIKHREAATVEELQALVRYSLAHPSVYNGCLLFIVATVCRVSEACLAETSEAGGDVWTIPAAHSKVGQDLRVPLSTLAKTALTMAPEGPYLFSGNSDGHLSRSTILNRIKRFCPRPEGEPVVTIHGIRSTFRDWCAMNGIPDAEAEKALGHAWGNNVTRAYYRTDLLEQRREVMQRWADVLTAESGC